MILTTELLAESRKDSEATVNDNNKRDRNWNNVYSTNNAGVGVSASEVKGLLKLLLKGKQIGELSQITTEFSSKI